MSEQSFFALLVVVHTAARRVDGAFAPKSRPLWSRRTVRAASGRLVCSGSGRLIHAASGSGRLVRESAGKITHVVENHAFVLAARVCSGRRRFRRVPVEKETFNPERILSRKIGR